MIACPIFAADAKTQPNVLFISIDDLRPELASYGIPRAKTPHLDAFAASGVQFNRAYCAVPVCGASRTSVLTGLRPTSKRFLGYNTQKDRDVPNIPSLPLWLRNMATPPFHWEKCTTTCVMMWGHGRRNRGELSLRSTVIIKTHRCRQP